MSQPPQPELPAPDDESGETYKLAAGHQSLPAEIIPPPPIVPFTPTPTVMVSKKSARSKASGRWARIGFNALVFVSSVCVMMLELTASRLIAKHLGSSLYTWTSVIGVVLAGITLGNWLGGWLADRYNRSTALAWSYLLGSIACGSVLWLDQIVGNIERPDALTWPTWVLTVVASIFLLPAFALGTTSPLVASMALEKSIKTGSTVGNVYAWGALGSIVGTFLTGFYLIDNWGTRSIVGITAATLAILAVIVAGSRRVFRAGVVLGWLQLLGWIMLVANARSEACADMGSIFGQYTSFNQAELDATMYRSTWADFGNRVGEKLHELGLILRLRDDALRQYHDESHYSTINVSEDIVDGKPVKSLRLDKLIHSYYDPSEPTALHYDYEKVYAAVTKKVVAAETTDPWTVPVSGLVGVSLTAQDLPESVTLADDGQSITISKPTTEIVSQLIALAPEAEYWKGVEYLYRETNKPLWGGFSSVSLEKLPEGTAIPDDISDHVRHDETLGVLIAYQPMTSKERDRLIDSSLSAGWYRALQDARRNSRRDTACFFGGGGFIFPRWYLQEFPGSSAIDVAELDPAVHQVVVRELGLTEEHQQRIRTIIGDARNFVDDRLRENAKRRKRGEPPLTYDFIYADAFNDFSIPWHLTTVEFLKKTFELMSERGVFQANIIDIYPRTEFPGRSVGVADADYSGRLPLSVVSGDVRRDKAVAATNAYAPLEITEVLSSQYRLHVSQTLTDADKKRLLNVRWPEYKPSPKFEIVKGYKPEIDVEAERENWRKAIGQLVIRSQIKEPYQGQIPKNLEVTDGVLEGWVSAVKPFEFVEAYRIGGDRYLLGFRGVISRDDEQKLIELDPQNIQWVQAIKASAIKSRAQRAGRFMGRFLATAAKVFPNVYLFSTSHQQPDSNRDTFVMVCSRKPLDLKSLEETGEWSGGPFASLETVPGQNEPVLSGQMSAVIGLAEGQILTDDFAPVDNLLIPVFNTQE